MPPSDPHARTVLHRFRAMGSPCEVLLEGPAASLDAAQCAVREVQRIEARYSRYQAGSVLSRINAAAGTGEVTLVDEETAALLDFAAALHARSGGLFDITSGVLRRAWDFRADLLPSQRELDALLPLIGWQQVRWRDGGVSLPRAGMELDFGGFGKEYAADRAASLLAAAGQAHGYVNLGGDIRVLGPHTDGTSGHFGIPHPRRADGVLASVRVAEGALATSGDYERFIERDGTRYCHILDPRSGWPCRGWQSVSVVAPACVAAGALTTVAMLMGPSAPDFLRSQGVAFMAVDAAGRAQGALDGAAAPRR
jgi:thiamine biosynthesis lipoprotein